MYNPKRFPFLDIHFRDLPASKWYAMRSAIEDLQAEHPDLAPSLEPLLHAMDDAESRHAKINSILEEADCATPLSLDEKLLVDSIAASRRDDANLSEAI